MLYAAAALLLWLAPRADANEAQMAEAYRTMLETTLTEIDVNGDGKADIHRVLDADGRLREITFTDPTRAPLRTYYARLQRPDSVFGRTTSVRELHAGASRSGALVWREHEQLLFGVVVYREHVEGANRWEQTFVKDRWTQRWYRGEKLLREETLEARPMALTAAALAQIDAQIGCLRARSPDADLSACRAELVTAFSSIGALTDFSRVARLSCSDGTTYHLGNGFRMDVASCLDPLEGGAATQADRDGIIATIRSATNAISGDMLSCLRDLNPDLADKYALMLQEHAPVIYCGGQQRHAGGIASRACAGSTEPGCAATLRGWLAEPDDSKRAFAFTWQPVPGAIMLQKTDPALSPSIRGSATATPDRAALRAAPDLEARMRVRNAAYVGPSLGSLLFHEYLHNCQIETPRMSEMHASEHKALYDPVFGCQATCSQGGISATQEDCLACAMANTADPAVNLAVPSATANMCRRLYPRALVARALNAPAGMLFALHQCRNLPVAQRAASDTCRMVFNGNAAAACPAANRSSDDCLNAAKAIHQRALRAVIGKFSTEGLTQWGRVRRQLHEMGADAEVEGFEPGN